MLLSVAKASLAFGSQQVLSSIEFVLNAGDRAGVVGANGAGKSTLLRIVAGLLAPDKGAASFAPGVVAGYLPQQPPEPPPGTSLHDLVREATGGLRALEAELRGLEARMAEPALDAVAFEAVLQQYGIAQEAFDRRGGYDLDWRIDAVFAGLGGIAHLPREQAFATLSGGEKARVQLAAILLRSPDVLLLDEPTNHLDASALEWLEGYLVAFRGGVLVVSHDRHFLNRVATRILEVDEHSHGLVEYPGDYDAYATARERSRERWADDYARQQDEIRELQRAIRLTTRSVGHAGRGPRDNDKFARGFFAGRVDVAVARNVRSAEERLRRIEADPIPRPPERLRVSPEFDVDALEGNTVFRIEGLRKAFDGRVVLDDVTFAIGPRDRVVITGANGAGKSTLLNILAGRETPDSGGVRVATAARAGYLDQDARDLDPSRTVFEAYREGLTGYRDELVRDLFRYGLFALDDLDKPVGALSTGERRKLQIARLIARRANALLLDEPTNHLGLDVLEEFERALASFEGPIVAVSHDRWFIERFRGRVWRLEAGRLVV